jgi:DNA-binding PadR family transcriptional regulator
MRADALKGHLDGLLLAALDAGPRHGYAVKEFLREGSGGQIDLPTGTIYPALRRLEQAGLIHGTWDTTEGRPRRTYKLTAAGRRALTGQREGWREFSAVVSALMEGRPCPGTP